MLHATSCVVPRSVHVMLRPKRRLRQRIPIQYSQPATREYASMLPRLLLAVFAIAALQATPAPAQPYPTQAIKIIVPNPAGGLPDTLSRIVGKRLQERLGQPVVIENRPGANAGLGTAALTTSAPDGYTFLMTDSAVFAISPLIYLKLPYDPKEAMPVAFVATAPIWLAANAKVPASTMQEFVAYAKSRGGEATYGTSGVGSLDRKSTRLNPSHVR